MLLTFFLLPSGTIVSGKECNEYVLYMTWIFMISLFLTSLTNPNSGLEVSICES